MINEAVEPQRTHPCMYTPALQLGVALSYGSTQSLSTLMLQICGFEHFLFCSRVLEVHKGWRSKDVHDVGSVTTYGKMFPKGGDKMGLSAV